MSNFILRTAAGRPFLEITEIADAELLVDPLFIRKFGTVGPRVPRHIVAFYRAEGDGRLHVAAFSHMMAYRGVLLSGGSCTDGQVVRLMSEEERAAVATRGSIYSMILHYAFSRFSEDCEAFFGYSADSRAIDVALTSGFVPTPNPRLFANWHRSLDSTRKSELQEMVEAIGPF